MSASTILALALCGGLIVTAAQARELKLRIRVSTEGGDHPTSREVIEYWTNGPLVSDEPHVRIVFDPERKSVTLIDKDARTYMVQSFADFHRAYTARRAVLGGLDPSLSSAPVTLTQTTRRATIGALEAIEYSMADGSELGSLWVAPKLPLPKRWPELTEVVPLVGFAASLGGAVGEAAATIGGAPVRCQLHLGKGITLTREIIEVNDESPPSDLLVPPPGFAAVAAPPAMSLPPPPTSGKVEHTEVDQIARAALLSAATAEEDAKATTRRYVTCTDASDCARRLPRFNPPPDVILSMTATADAFQGTARHERGTTVYRYDSAQGGLQR